MGLTWQPWTSVSEGSTTPGAPVAAVPWGNTFALFLSDPNGGIYAIKAVPGYGWELVPGRSSKPGAPITALWPGNRFVLFMADANGEVFTTSGVPYQGWQPWTSVSEGSTMPGAPVAAVPWGDSFALFLSDPNGGVYGIKAVPGYGWELVPGRSSKPGAPITALWSGNRFVLFMADVNGEVFTTSGLPYQGWQPWTSVSEGSTTPGAPVAAVPWGNSFALFLSDPNGGIYGIKAVPGYGWELVPGRSSKPGAQITAVPWYPPPSSPGVAQPRFLLFMTDVNGEIVMTSGVPYQGWDPWTSVSGVSGTPGAPVAASTHFAGLTPFTLFIADSGGEVFETSTSAPPAMPVLSVMSVTAQTINVSWTESNPASVEVEGFELTLTRMINNGEVTTLTLHGPAERTASYTGLDSGVQYTIRIAAFNANGYSPTSSVVATTPVATQTVFLNLTAQGGGVGSYVPYVAKYPPFGVVSPGHLTQITVPSPGIVPRVAFVKEGHSSEMCGDPNSVVIVLAGQTTSPAQMTAIFGVAEPPFSSTSPIGFVACVDGGQLPTFIQIQLTITEG